MRHRRVYHKLKANKARKAPKYVIFFDTETKEKNLTPTKKELSLRLGYATFTRRIVGKGYVPTRDCEFTKRAQFNNWLLVQCRGRECYYVVAHNIGFDIRVTGSFKALTRAGWKRTMFIMDGLNFMARFRKGNTSIFFINNMQLFNTKLSELGASIGIPKLEVDFATVGDEELMTYCKRDVEVMRVAWNKWSAFIRENDLGNFKGTIGSQAFSSFRHRFMNTDIFIHTNEKAIALERESYHGGRVECFRIGEYADTKVYNLDINSMYPYIMSTIKVPVKLRAYYEDISIRDFTHVRRNFGYIVEATLQIARPTLPSVRSGRLVFPIGEVHGYFTKPELEAALEQGTLLSVRRCCVYDEERVFAPYVDFFYEARRKFKQEGNESFGYFAKLLLNSLYGKFGQRIVEYKVVGKNPLLSDQAGRTYDMLRGRNVAYRVIDGIIEIEDKTTEANDSFVAIASYITGAARAYLSEIIQKAGWDHVLYCDTDSVFTDQQGFDRLAGLIDLGGLGKLKVEGVAERVTILGAKRYNFNDKRVSKGIRPNAVLVGDDRYVQEQFESFAGGLRSGHTESVIINLITKQLSPDYLKGTVQPDGRVLPLTSLAETPSLSVVAPTPLYAPRLRVKRSRRPGTV